ncbi:Starch-binding associating with outer membrane [Mariniphaga anaerophila]|uniref:Starch-binding associating with outer membrane n=2 Tax=Mariniphaga anaerophila TaxID=1484053 RepID=A0A1M4V9E2_9BACT|nr:Starch-binding associating with outer membrane [Mariniphaga anaerophila]
MLFTGLLLFSCSDEFLEREPLGFVAPETFLNNEEELNMMVNGIYNQVDFMGVANTHFKNMNPYYNEALTDLVYGAQPWQGWTEFARGQGNSESNRVEWKWDRNYQGIARANSFLLAIEEKTELDPDIRKRGIAEAKFLRAWFYLDLISFYGDVPLLLVPGDLENSTPERTPVDQVRTQMLKDLDEAIPDLPKTYPNAEDAGRVTQGAALALKSRILLYGGEWAGAAAAAKEVMDLGVYSLFPDYNGLFLEKNEAQASNTEVIFQVYYTATTSPSAQNMMLMNWWPSFCPTLKAANSYYMANGLPITNPESGYDPENPFINRDPRFAMSIYYPGGPFKYAAMPNLKVFDFYMLGQTGFKCRKFVDEELEQSNLQRGQGENKIFMRYGEILLNYAEAQNEAVGPDATVYDAIDQLRNRVGMTTLSEAMPGLSKDEMREVIRNERLVELAFEGLRIFDIRRWKIGEEVMDDAIGLDNRFLKQNKYPGDGNGITATWYYVEKISDTRAFVPTRDYLWPIPQKEINANPNMTQNPGYN